MSPEPGDSTEHLEKRATPNTRLLLDIGVYAAAGIIAGFGYLDAQWWKRKNEWEEYLREREKAKGEGEDKDESESKIDGEVK